MLSVRVFIGLAGKRSSFAQLNASWREQARARGGWPRGVLSILAAKAIALDETNC
jgi:hypothetical protein